MAMIACPDCEKQISSEAVSCPNCGKPMEKSSWSGDATSFRRTSPLPVRSAKSRGVYIILGLFFGLLGVHNFYAGYLVKDALQLIITLTLGWIIVGVVITGIWVILEIIMVDIDANGNTFE